MILGIPFLERRNIVHFVFLYTHFAKEFALLRVVHKPNIGSKYLVCWDTWPDLNNVIQVDV